MASDIQLLELASGIKDSLVRAGFLTIESILASSIADLSSKVGVDPYIAQIILQVARKFGKGTNEQQSTMLISDVELS
jgi:small basic protein